MTNRFKRTIDVIDGGRNLKKVLVGHDWGAYFCFLLDFQAPSYISEFVCIDLTFSLESDPKTLAFLISWQAHYDFGLAFCDRLCRH